MNEKYVAFLLHPGVMFQPPKMFAITSVKADVIGSALLLDGKEVIGGLQRERVPLLNCIVVSPQNTLRAVKGKIIVSGIERS